MLQNKFLIVKLVGKKTHNMQDTFFSQKKNFRKKFNSKNSYDNHLKSKKHLEKESNATGSLLFC